MTQSKCALEWNKKIRDSVDQLLSEAGFAPDSSARHQLTLMNFDAIDTAHPWDEYAKECVKALAGAKDPAEFVAAAKELLAAADQWWLSEIDDHQKRLENSNLGPAIVRAQKAFGGLK